MRTIILLAIMGILLAGYSVATKATAMVSDIKAQQVQQIALLNN